MYKVRMDRKNKVNTNNSCLQGHFRMGTSYKELSKVFGKPAYEETHGNGKTKCEWVGTIEGDVFTIYDYKQPVAPEYCQDWHIGGFKEEVALKLQLHLKEKQLRRLLNK